MGMTKQERAELTSLIRKREKVLKLHAAERSAAMLAEFENQIVQAYSYDQDEVWKRLAEEARAAVEGARAEIAKRCEALGIAREFAPDMSVHWHGRGQNAVKERRDELRRAAKSRIDALEREAITNIEKMSLEAQTQVIASGLVSDDAQKFLKELPDMALLMPPIDLGSVQTLIEKRLQERERQRLAYLQ